MAKCITAKQVLEMIHRQGFRCALTGRELTPESASLDHIVPLARGGAHSLDNLWAVDQQANRAKGTMTVAEFVALCREVSKFYREPTSHLSSEPIPDCETTSGVASKKQAKQRPVHKAAQQKPPSKECSSEKPVAHLF